MDNLEKDLISLKNDKAETAQAKINNIKEFFERQTLSVQQRGTNSYFQINHFINLLFS